MIRQGKMPQSESLLGRMLNSMAGGKKGVMRHQRINGAKLPDFDTVVARGARSRHGLDDRRKRRLVRQGRASDEVAEPSSSRVKCSSTHCASAGGL